MLFLVAIAFLLKRYGTHAVPLPVPTPTYSVLDTPIFARDNTSDGCHNRTVLDIIWSCLATTFACTWVSVHPNVPWRNEGKWTLLGRRIFLMLFSILAPEFMIVWAFKQWRGAVMIREAVNEASRQAFPDPQDPRQDIWTTTHGHLLQMGGFRLIATQRENLFCKGVGPVLRSLHARYAYPWQSELGKLITITSSRSEDLIPKRFHYRHETSEGFTFNDYAPDNELNDNIWEGVLTINSLKQLLSENLIRLPTITEDEINDKSKGDALSKGIALLQLTWLIAQIITRAARGLAITELELTTAALAGLNSVMYIFWWSKPRDVRFPVVVRTKGVEELLAERAEDATWSFSDEEFDFRKHLWISMTTPIKGVLNGLRKLPIPSPKAIKTMLSDLVSATSVLPGRLRSFFLKRRDSGDPKRTEEKGSVNTPAVADSEPHSEKEKKSRMQQIYGALSSGAEITAYAFAFLISLPAYVINLLLFLPIAQILHSDGRELHFSRMVFDADEQARVVSMMFYSEDAEPKSLFLTASIAGALFGGVHCLAWHFSFPSHAEQIIWRTASSGIVGACALMFVGSHGWNYIIDIVNTFMKLLFAILFLLNAVVYPISRLLLLVLAVTSLRSLPPSAFDTAQWVEFVPHI